MIWQAMKYLRFAGVQRNINLKDLDTEISDFKESRIVDDDHFSSEDVRELLDSLVTTIRADVYRDLQRMAHSTVVLLRQCMQQSAEHGISLTVDTGLLEDEKVNELKSSPLNRISPVSGISKPAKKDNNVLLPEPDGPTIATLSPGLIFSSREFKTDRR